MARKYRGKGGRIHTKNKGEEAVVKRNNGQTISNAKYKQQHKRVSSKPRETWNITESVTRLMRERRK